MPLFLFVKLDFLYRRHWIILPFSFLHNNKKSLTIESSRHHWGPVVGTLFGSACGISRKLCNIELLNIFQYS